MNRVLFFVPSLQIGGSENQLRYLATGINRDEFEPVVWCPGPWGPVGDALKAAGVSVLDHSLDLSGSATVDELLGWLADLRASIFYSFATDSIWVDAVLAKTARIPVCITRRANTRYGDNAGVRNLETDVIVANCAAVAAASIVAEGSSELVRVIPNGIPLGPEPAPESRGPVVVGNVANYRPLKGHRFLIDAFRRVLPVAPGAELLIAGRTDPELDQLAQGSRVLLLGELADPVVAYRRMTLYVHSSLSEGLPGAVLEAMSHGLAVVATDAGGTAEAVEDGVTGILVPPADAGALAQAMTELLLDEPKRRRMGAAGRERVAAEFSVDLLVSRHEALFRRAVAGCRLPVVG